MKKIKIFQTEAGKKPFREWLNKIKDVRDRVRIWRRVDRLELGHKGDYKKLATDLYELRLFFGSGYRIYFTELDDEIIILLLGGDKKSQTKDVAKAKEYLSLLKGGL